MKNNEKLEIEQKNQKTIKRKKINNEGSTFKTSEVIILVLLTCIFSLSFGIFLQAQTQIPKRYKRRTA